MSEVTEFVQGDYTFYIRPMDPFKALELSGDLQRTILPTIGAAIGKSDLSEFKKVNKDKPLTVADMLSMNIDIHAALGQLSGALNGTNITNLMQRILDTEYIAYEHDGTSKKLDKAALRSIYVGNLSGMFALAWKVLQVNYSDFFTTLPTQFGQASEKASQ
jgi:hypothetical protein